MNKLIDTLIVGTIKLCCVIRRQFLKNRHRAYCRTLFNQAGFKPYNKLSKSGHLKRLFPVKGVGFLVNRIARMLPILVIMAHLNQDAIFSNYIDTS